MNDYQRESLKKLRDSAALDEWSLCRENTAKLLADLSEFDITQIIHKQLNEFLFAIRNSSSPAEDIQEAIEALNSVNSFDSLKQQAGIVYSLTRNRASQPGINNYRNALKLLSQPDAFGKSNKSTPEIALDVISGVLMAILDYSWGHRNTELWLRSFRHETKEDFFIRARHFISDPQVIELSKSLWIEVANDLEVALSRDN